MQEVILLLTGVYILVGTWYIQKRLREMRAEERRKVRNFQKDFIRQMTEKDKEKYQPRFEGNKLIINFGKKVS